MRFLVFSRVYFIRMGFFGGLVSGVFLRYIIAFIIGVLMTGRLGSLG